MPGEIRAKESRVEVTVNGQTLGGSFATIHDVDVKPDVSIEKKRFTGMKRALGDLDVKGYDFSFKTEKRDHLWMQLWDLIQQAELNGQPLPEITLTLTYNYRDGSGQPKVDTLAGGMVLKMDSNSIPKDGYQGATWTGFCSYNSADKTQDLSVG